MIWRIPVAVFLVAAASCRGQEPPVAPPAVKTRVDAATAPVIEAALTDQDRTNGQAVLNTACVGCHSYAMLEQQRLTRKQWDAVLKKMTTWGAVVETAQLSLTARVAAERFGLTAGTFALEPVAASAALKQALDPLPDGRFAGGDASAGRQVYTSSCGACHGPAGAGGPLGVNVADRPILYRADDLAALVRTGRGRMPGFPVEDGQVASLIAYLRKLP